MRHRDYVADRTAREPLFENERNAAAAELMLSGAIAARRQSLKVSLEHLANETGIPEDRLEAIEDGESMTLNEALWLLHALDLRTSIDGGFRLVTAPMPRLTVRFIGTQETPATSGYSAESATGLSGSIVETTSTRSGFRHAATG
jgi:transcriptional regulator with XRE-family HTH domain